tara:strand:- start:962 stop:1303 length:342 start_codon:yes stop_codon:yes gene_type:complete
MKKFLLLLTLFFATESEAGESPVTEDDWDKFTTAVVVVGGIAFIAAFNNQIADELNASDYMYFDEQNNSIIFSEDSGLENFEINFSKQMSQNVFESNNFFSSNDLYVGLTYRF